MTNTAAKSDQESSSENLTRLKDDEQGTETNPEPNDDNKSTSSDLLVQPPTDQQSKVAPPKSPETGPATKQIPSGGNLTSNSSTSQPQISIEQQLAKSKRDLESMVLKYARSEQENLKNKQKVEDLDKKLKRAIKDNDQLANRIKLLTNDKNHLTDTLNAKVAQLTVLEQKNTFLTNVQGSKLRECEENITKLEARNEDLLKQIESYKSKEGELLDFSERLSMKHIILQTELDEALKKVPSFKDQYEQALMERDDLALKCGEMSKQIDNLTISLKEERENLDKEKNARRADDLSHINTVMELQNHIKIMRRKNCFATNELIKKIKHLELRSSEAPSG